MKNNPGYNRSTSPASGAVSKRLLALRPICEVILALFLSLLIFSTAAADATKIMLTAADGYRIVGSLGQGDGRLGVVLLHMYRQDRRSWQPLVEQLNGRGIATLAIDMRGHGESRFDPAGHDAGSRVLARDPELFKRMHYDAEAAVRYLLERGMATQVGFVGASVGCSVALQTVSEGIVPVGAVVLMTPGKNYLGLASMDHIKNWPGRPLLILSSRAEMGRGAQAIYSRLKNKGATIRIFTEEDIHGTNMFAEVDGVEALIADWLAQALAKPEQSSAHLPIYRIKLRVHLANSARAPEEFKPIFAEINKIWQSQAGICFEIHAVYRDTSMDDGLDMWFAPDIGGFNGYYDGERIMMSDAPVLAKATNPAHSSAARTAAHELGHALELPHRQESDNNLMRSRTYGWQLNEREILLAREAATDIAIEDTVPLGCGAPRFDRRVEKIKQE